MKNLQKEQKIEKSKKETLSTQQMLLISGGTENNGEPIDIPFED